MEEQPQQQQQQQQQQQPQELPPAVVKVRWKPNDEQLRMLVRLFEEEGDSINKQRIKEIAVDLARCGDVTEANVHNWFHNRKARAKRKQKLMQQNDGESEVDTDVDSKGKRTKVDHSKPIGAAVTPSMYLPEFSPPEAQPGFIAGFPIRQPLRLPSDAVNLSNRMYENSLMLTSHSPFPTHSSGEKFRLPGFHHPEANVIEWSPRPLALLPTQAAATQVLDRSSESKTITDDASTESEDISDTRAWNNTNTNNNNSSSSKVKKPWKKKGKGTMIRRPVERASNGRSRSGRRSRIRELLRSLKRSGGEYERDLKTLFVEVVRRLGGSKARSILNRLTRHDSDSSSASLGMDSGSCSSTASLPRQARGISSSSPSGFRAPAEGSFYKRSEGIHHQLHLHHQQQPQQLPVLRQCSSASKHWEAHELTLSSTPRQVQERCSSSGSGEESEGDEETDCEREDFRIVWSSQQKQQESLAAGLFAPSSSALENSGKQKLQVSSKLELMPGVEGEKVSVPLSAGRPTGASGTWWNSTLRHSALQHLDISIPHIGLQPEEGLVRIRDHMESKFVYVGGSLDDSYLKKQVAKALNFRRHKVMRLIEQGAKRPSDVTEEQWESLIKYYADPKRREKSDKQRAALKALNLNNQHQHQQQQQQALNLNNHQQQQQVLIEQQQIQIQQQQQQQQAHHHHHHQQQQQLNLNMTVNVSGSGGSEEDDEGDEGDEDDEETEGDEDAPDQAQTTEFA